MMIWLNVAIYVTYRLYFDVKILILFDKFAAPDCQIQSRDFKTSAFITRMKLRNIANPTYG